MINRIAFALTIGLGIISCAPSDNETSTSETVEQPAEKVAQQDIVKHPGEVSTGALYVSGDGSFRLRVLTEQDGDTETLRLRDEGTGDIHVMKHVPAASGVRYEDENGYFFWTKGNDFLWGKGEETLANGTLRK